MNYRVLEKDNFDFNITLDLDELKKHIDKSLKDSDSDYLKDSESDFDIFQDGSIRCLKYKFVVPFDRLLQEEVFDLLIGKIGIEIFDKEGINIHMSVIKFSDADPKMLILAYTFK